MLVALDPDMLMEAPLPNLILAYRQHVPKDLSLSADHTAYKS